MSGSPAKDALRAGLLAARSAMPDAERARARAAVCAVALERCRAVGWRTVAAYEPLRTEPGSTPLLAGLHALGVQVLVPLTLADDDLDWTVWQPDRAPQPLAVSTGDLGVQALTRADAVLVPALAVARDGTRLGRGRGCYDRALHRVRADADLAAVVFDHEVVDTMPAQPWDVAVRAALTPGGWRPLGTPPAAARDA